MSNLLKWPLTHSFSTLGYALLAQTLPLPSARTENRPSQPSRHFVPWPFFVPFVHGPTFSLLLRYFLLPSAPLPCFKSSQAFTFLSSCVLRSCLHIPPQKPVPTSTACTLPFSVWAQSGVPPWAELAPCHVCLTSCTSEQAVLLPVVVLGDQLALLGPFASNGILPTSSLNKPRSALPKFKISVLLPAYLLSRSLYCHLMIAAAKAVTNLHSFN